ncbi:hypothetical protein PR048_003651 [Dryococelus australis]|uniref:C2H2-type domain-containing protein n=1 Tax=Dryococelus australis TaxID=614101 RepID=A0ABQ9INM1_9NEOP|nr:hypothetical protein PR048_003651 [Dryococelus australis]
MGCWLGSRSMGFSSIRPSNKLLQAVEEAPEPINKEELPAYCGLLNYYGKFLPALASRLCAFYELLKQNVPWEWNYDLQQLFQDSKSWLLQSNLLVHYNPDKPLVLTCNSSPKGVGAVLLHIEDGREMPIGIHCVKKFHNYIYGCKFILETDHKPLTAIFGEKTVVPSMAQHNCNAEQKNELTVEEDCILVGSRVVIPETLWNVVLAVLHEEHPGSSCMKMLARSHVWWPGLDGQIEEVVQSCHTCQSVQSSTRKVALEQRSWPARKWQRVHVDFAMTSGRDLLTLLKMSRESTATSTSLQHMVDNYLFSYRNIPSSTTGKTPAELFHGRNPRTRLTVLKPSLNFKMQTKQRDKQLESFSTCAPLRQFAKGDNVWVCTVKGEKLNWVPGQVKDRVCAITYQVYTQGRIRFCHADHIKERHPLHSGGIPADGGASGVSPVTSRRWTWSNAATLTQPAAGSVKHQQPLGSGELGVCSPPLGDQLAVEEALTPMGPEGSQTVGGFKGFPNDGGSLPAVGSCKKVYMIRKKNKPKELEAKHVGENVFSGGEFEVMSKDEVDCQVLEDCLSPSVDGSESYLSGDLVQFVNVHLQQDSFLVESNLHGEDLCTTASESALESKIYQCSKCCLNFSDKSKLLFHEISEHVGEASVKISNNVSDLNCTKNGVIVGKQIACKKYRRERTACKQCGQDFIGQRPLKRHIHECHAPKDTVCLYCGAHYTVRSQLLAHLRLHTNEKPYSCLLCDAKFHFKKELRRHKHLHATSQVIACTICDKVFNSRHSLWRHKRIHSQNRCVLCYLCGKVLSNTQSLKVHLRTHSSERPCTCESCGKKFKDNVSLLKHMIMHSAEKKFLCDICNRAFYSKALVKQHKLSHSGVKPYKCEVCGSCFNRLGNLNQHKKRHLHKEESDQSKLDSSFECTVCGKKMRSELTLKYHIAKHTGEKKPFDCETCGKRFVAIEPYRVHMRIHTGERPYVCGVCNKSFRSPYTLKQHMGLHRDEFPYPCPFCERRFKRLQSLIVHKRTHTGEKPHVCPMCNRCFAQKGDMLKHTKTHTRDNLPPTNKDHGDELVLEMDHITDFALSDAEITNEFLINMPIVEVQTEIQ